MLKRKKLYSLQPTSGAFTTGGAKEPQEGICNQINQPIKYFKMRTQLTSLFTTLNSTALENLTREIKETVATGIQVRNVKPVFTAANLWNIHNMRRERTSRRYM